jgi:hypothetical protein
MMPKFNLMFMQGICSTELKLKKKKSELVRQIVVPTPRKLLSLHIVVTCSGEETRYFIASLDRGE